MEQSRVTLEELTPVRKRLQIEIAADAVQAEVDRAFQTVGQQARLRGFRPGRAPRAVLEQYFGPQVRREVLERLVEASFHDAVKTHGLAVVGMPDIDADDLTIGKALRYSATVDVRPVITLADMTGLEAKRPSTTVSDDDVERVVGQLRESAAQLRPIEERTVVEAGDVVSIDLSSTLDGGEPTKREDVLIEAGTGTFPEALERQLVGQHVGVHLTLQVPYPADYGNPGLAGKTATFEVTVKQLRAKELPALDDDFARDHGRAGSLAELRQRIRTELEKDAESRADDAVREAVLTAALGRHSFDVPPSLVDRRIEALASSLDVRLPEGAEQEGAVEALRARLGPIAERQVRADLLLDALAERDGISVSDAEVATEVETMAARDGRVVERVRAFYERPDARAALRAQMTRHRALVNLVAAARVMPDSAADSVAREK